MFSRSLMLFVMFLTSSVAKYGSVVVGLFSAIVPEGLKGKGPSVHDNWTLCGTLYISDS